MSKRRHIIVKVGFSDDEMAQIEQLQRRAGMRSRAAFLRQKALEPQAGTSAIGDLIGRVGLTLNMYDGTDPKPLNRLSADLSELTAELRKQRTG